MTSGYLIMVTLAQQAPVPEPTPDASCRTDAICSTVFRVTGNVWLAEGSLYRLVKPVTIVLIMLGAVITRFALHRTINRLVSTTANSPIPTVLRPLKHRQPGPPRNGGAVTIERRRQRAEAIGSVLRSSVTAVVFSIATLTALGEVGLDLAPLLASAGIAGLALGFGAQSLVKDLLAGLFMLLEDQYGVGDTVDLGEATGVVETVGLRVTTVRDGKGVLWYIRNGEIVRVGNSSQGWSLTVIDLPIGFASVDEATTVLRQAAARIAEDPGLAADLVDPPKVVGVEQITVDGAVVRTTARTSHEAQGRITRELRRRLAEALEVAGISPQITARTFPRPAAPSDDDAGTPGG